MTVKAESFQRGARVVVVGAGFAGSSFLRGLPPLLRRPGETLLIDRADEYPFIPLIHEVAVGRIHPDSIRFPIEDLCKGRCEFLNAEVTGLNLTAKTLQTTAGEVGYEYLVLASGSGAARPPDEIREYFQLFWTLEDALKLRSTLSEAWNEALDRRTRPDPGLLNVAIVGGGATGVELAAEVATLFQYLRKRTTRKPAAESRVLLFEAEDRLLGWLDPYFHRVAMEDLGKLGVEVRLGTVVEAANFEGVKGGDEWFPARTRIWTTGIDVAPLVRELPGEHDPSGRVSVDAHLTLQEYPEVYVLGDAALYEDPRHGVLPPTASVAVQEGPWAARDIGRRLSAKARPPFDFFDRGYVVSLGPESAVAKAVGAKLRGPAAQALYRSIFLYYLKRSRDRVLATSDWAMERTLGRVGFGRRA
ncbi:MAG TPA: NAD(P)/FAD-dependent oxidoreductase [Rubrobacteraceae bacterium]|nr:NAD(P)/FAD-dependent oxidoreductase [Rubrobacteraceae bacterium]